MVGDASGKQPEICEARLLKTPFEHALLVWLLYYWQQRQLQRAMIQPSAKISPAATLPSMTRRRSPIASAPPGVARASLKP